MIKLSCRIFHIIQWLDAEKRSKGSYFQNKLVDFLLLSISISKLHL